MSSGGSTQRRLKAPRSLKILQRSVDEVSGEIGRGSATLCLNSSLPRRGATRKPTFRYVVYPNEIDPAKPFEMPAPDARRAVEAFVTQFEEDPQGLATNMGYWWTYGVEKRLSSVVPCRVGDVPLNRLVNIRRPSQNGVSFSRASDCSAMPISTRFGLALA